MSLEDTHKEIGLRIELFRKAAGLTQHELADAVGMGRTSITNIESSYQRVTIDSLYLISAYLGCKINDLLPEYSALDVSPKVAAAFESVKQARDVETEALRIIREHIAQLKGDGRK